MMMSRSAVAALLVIGLLAASPASAQTPASTSFDELLGRIRIGQVIWVTDRGEREIQGRLERLSGDGLILAADSLTTFTVSDILRVRAHERDSFKNGTLIGLGIGGGMAAAWCAGAVADDSGDINASVECAEGFITFPALGALIGLVVDAAIPGKIRAVYEATQPASRMHLTVVPRISARATGLALSFAF